MGKHVIESFKFKPIILMDRFERWKMVAREQKVSREALQRLDWLIFYYTRANKNASLVCRHFGIARKTFHKWFNLFDERNIRSMESQNKSPINKRKPEYTPEEIQKTIALRQKYPTLGRLKLQILYREEYGVSIHDWHLRRIIHDFKLFAERAVKTKRRKVQGRIWKKRRISDLKKEPFSGFLLELDSIVIYFSNEKRYILTAIDYHSRFAFACMYKSKASLNAADFLRRLYLLFDGRIQNIHIYNGSEFKKEFLKAAEKLKIKLYHARPYQPKDKPLIERFNGIIQQEYINLGHFTLDVEKFNNNLIDWLLFYNFKRPHHSLGLQRPIDYVNLKSKVLPMYSPMTMG
jgi:transposase InsO family protein